MKKLLLTLAMLLIAGQAYAGRPAPPTNDAVGHWTMDDNAASTTVLDAKGVNNGTAQANTNTLSTTNAIHNRAMTFNGSSDYISTVSPNTLGLGSAYTFAVWVKPTTLSAIANFIFAAGSEKYELHLRNDLTRFIPNGYPASALDFSVVPIGEWSHLVVTLDNSTGDAKAYINGVLDNSATGRSIPSDTTILRIGIRGDTTLPFDGILDDVRIYDRALTASDIAALYQAGRQRTGDVGFSKMLYPPIDQSVVGWWKLNDNAANTTVKDWTNNDNTGTAQANTSTKTATGYTGVANTALTFNGSSDYASIASSNLTSGNWTISAWVKFNAFSTTSIVQDVGTSFSFGLVTYASKIGWIEGANPASSGQYMTTALSTGVWYHLVAQKNAVYVDGVSQQLSALGFALTGSSRIGKADSYQLFNGSLSDVRIYDRALSSREVKSLYMRGRN